MHITSVYALHTRELTLSMKEGQEPGGCKGTELVRAWDLETP